MLAGQEPLYNCKPQLPNLQNGNHDICLIDQGECKQYQCGKLLMSCKKLCRVSAGCQILKTLTLPFSSLPQGSGIEPMERGGDEAFAG